VRELIVNTFLTLDGVMQAPGGPEEDPSGGFEHGGWSFGYWDEQMQKAMGESMSKPFDLVLGRKTYEIFAAFWPNSDAPAAEPLNKANKHVASTSLKELEWENSKLIEGEVPEGLRALKAEDGPELQVHGSANLIQTLLEHGLVEEFRLQIFPLVLGKGKRLFGSGTVPAAFRLTKSAVSPNGVLIASYERAGAVKTGSFALDTPTPAEVERRRKLGAS
jgi:dihydrofolate reductase